MANTTTRHARLVRVPHIFAQLVSVDTGIVFQPVRHHDDGVDAILVVQHLQLIIRGAHRVEQAVLPPTRMLSIVEFNTARSSQFLGCKGVVGRAGKQHHPHALLVILNLFDEILSACLTLVILSPSMLPDVSTTSITSRAPLGQRPVLLHRFQDHRSGNLPARSWAAPDLRHCLRGLASRRIDRDIQVSWPITQRQDSFLRFSRAGKSEKNGKSQTLRIGEAGLL